MKKQFNTRFKSPVKINLELTGPIKGFCDIPVGRTDGDHNIMASRQLKRILKNAKDVDIMMYTMMLSDSSDLFEEQVINLIKLVNSETAGLGILKSLFLPLQKIKQQQIETLGNKIDQIISENKIDSFSIYVPFKKYYRLKESITSMLIKLNSRQTITMKLYTNLPNNVSEIDSTLLPLIEYIVKTANLSDALLLGFIILNEHYPEYKDIIRKLNELCGLSDYIFLLQPPIQPCRISSQNNGGEVLIPHGFCPGGNIFITYTSDCHFAPCLKFRDVKLSGINTLLYNWGKVDNKILKEIDACSQCKFNRECNGLCTVYDEAEVFEF